MDKYTVTARFNKNTKDPATKVNVINNLILNGCRIEDIYYDRHYDDIFITLSHPISAEAECQSANGRV